MRRRAAPDRRCGFLRHESDNPRSPRYPLIRAAVTAALSDPVFIDAIATALDAAVTPPPPTDAHAAVEDRQPGDPEPPLLLRSAEAARLCNLSRSTFYALTRSGDIPTIRVGRSAIRVPRKELIRWIDDRMSESETLGA